MRGGVFAGHYGMSIFLQDMNPYEYASIIIAVMAVFVISAGAVITLLIYACLKVSQLVVQIYQKDIK